MITNIAAFDRWIEVMFVAPRIKEKRPARDLFGHIIPGKYDVVLDSDTSKGAEIVQWIPPSAGPKPDINIQMRMLPGFMVHDVSLTLTNAYLSLDLHRFEYVRVRAGYKQKGSWTSQAEFDLPIFSSFVESPNPNGTTVFKCVSAGYLKDVNDPTKLSMRGLVKQPYIVDFYDNNVNVYRFITTICDALGVDDQATPNLPYDFLKMNVALSKGRHYAATGYEVFEWLQRELTSLSQQYNAGRAGYNLPVVCQLYQNVFTAFLPGFSSKLNAPELNFITSATFQGAVLVVEGPWNPIVRPGNIFRLSTKYFRGNPTPDTALNAFKDPNDFYRVITLELNFSTNGSTNNMKIMAVAASRDITEVSVENLNNLMAIEQIETVLQDSSELKRIDFGTPENYQKELTDAFLSFYKKLPASYDYVVREGDTILNIANYFYGNGIYTGRESVKIEDDNPKVKAWIAAQKDKYKDKLSYVDVEEVYGFYFWPLIIVASYGKTLENYPIKPEEWPNPDNADILGTVLEVGKKIAIPGVSGAKVPPDIKVKPPDWKSTFDPANLSEDLADLFKMMYTRIKETVGDYSDVSEYTAQYSAVYTLMKGEVLK